MIEPSYLLRLIPRWNHTPLSRLIPHWTMLYLGQVVRGFIQYHGVPGNFRRVSAFRNEVVKLWKHVLTRRSQKDKTTWERMLILAGHWLPPARILHPWPDARFLVKHPRWEPSALIRPARIYAGGAG